ncbi:MAG: hypothetical protein QXH07_01775 [Thermoplasmata archaeon]
MDTVMAFVYWYPPAAMTPTDISAIGSDGYYGFFLVNLEQGVLGTNIVSDLGINLGKGSQIVLTPDAFTAWYETNITEASKNSTLAFLYQSATEPVNGYADMNAETAAFLTEQGFYWLPYDPNYPNEYNVSSAAIDPVKQYGFTSNELYMLIRPAVITTSATGTNGLATSTSLTQGALQNQETQTVTAQTNVAQNTTYPAQQAVSNAVNALGNAASQPLAALGKDLEIGLIAAGIFALAGIAIYAYVSSH